MKDPAMPMLPASEQIEVDVTRSFAGNQIAETSGAPAIETGPAKPFKIWPMFINLSAKNNKQIISLIA